MEELKHTIVLQRKVHQDEVEGLRTAHQIEVERQCDLHSVELLRKDSFCKAEKFHVLIELQTSYNTKLPGLYDEHY